MKWSWKAFAVESVVLVGLSFALGYLICSLLESRAGSIHRDFTMISMTMGSVLASIVLVFIGAWRFWRPRPLFISIVLISSIASANPAVGFLSLMLSAGSYVAAKKIRTLRDYYFPSHTDDVVE